MGDFINKYRFKPSECGWQFDHEDSDYQEKLLEYFRAGRARRTYKKLLEYSRYDDVHEYGKKELSLADIQKLIADSVKKKIDEFTDVKGRKKDDIFNSCKISSTVVKKTNLLVFGVKEIRTLLDKQSDYLKFLTDKDFEIVESTLAGYKFFNLYLQKFGPDGLNTVKDFTRGGMQIGSRSILTMLRDYLGLCNIIAEVQLLKKGTYDKDEAYEECSEIAEFMFKNFCETQKNILTTISSYERNLAYYLNNAAITSIGMDEDVIKYLGFDKVEIKKAKQFSEKFKDLNFKLEMEASLLK